MGFDNNLNFFFNLSQLTQLALRWRNMTNSDFIDIYKPILDYVEQEEKQFDKLKTFFYGEFKLFSTHSLLSVAGIEKQESLEDIFSFLKKLDEKELRRLFYDAVLHDGERAFSLDPDTERGDFIDLLEKISIPEEGKWRLLKQERNIRETFLDYLDALKDLSHSFLTWYKKQQTQVEELVEVFHSGKEEEYFGEIKRRDVFHFIRQFREKDYTLLVDLVYASELGAYEYEHAHFFRIGSSLLQGLRIMEKIRSEEEGQLVDFFSHLGDKNRYHMIGRLLEEDVTNKRLANELGISAASVSYHVNQLVNSEILSLKPEGGSFAYQVNLEKIEARFQRYLSILKEKKKKGPSTDSE